MRAGRKSEAQTPAPIEDRIYGSSKNAPNTATRSNADNIVLSEGIENTLRAKLEIFLKDNPDQKGTITLSDLKAVFRRGAGAYSKSHRPTITGGVPNSRNAWAYARVNKFLQKAGGMKVKKAYIQDDDLMKYKDGGNVPFNIHREFNEYVDKLPKFGYHGTQSKTLINPRPSKDGRYGEGFYLTSNPKTAEYFGRFTKTSQGYSTESDSANVFEFDLRGLNLKYYKRAEDMPYIDFDELDKKNYDGIYLYNEGEIVIFNIYKLQEGKLIKSLDGTTYNTNNPDIRYAKGGLIAPNGKKSNLTPEQYKLVRTKAFKDWFGDWENDPANASKVVDDNGEPLVVWHGSQSNDEFNVFKQSSRFEFIYFAKTKEYAWFHFTKDTIRNPFQLRPFFLNIRNLLNAEEYGFEKVDFRELEMFFYGIHELSKDIQLNPKSQYRIWEVLRFSNDIYHSIKNQGYYNGISFYENFYENTNWNDTDDYTLSYVVMNPNQIKLADGSNTTFDGSNPDIRFEDGGETPVFGSVENSPYRGFTEEEVMAYDFPEIYKIAEKHHMGSKTIHTEFIKGVFHEQEHTSDWGLSAHTSLQHLWEVPDYYTKLNAVKLAKGGKVKKGKGDCYQTSGTIAIDGGIRGVEFVGKPYVVHAEVRGQGDLMGVRFGHSWVEDDEFVYDYSNGKDLKIPKFFYYYLGDIQKVEPKYYRYTFAEAKKKMLESGHFGSWELETESGL